MSSSFIVSGSPPTLWWVLMVADGPFEGNAFDDIGIEGSLSEIFDIGDAVGFLFEEFDEKVADDLALLLRIDDAPEALQEELGGVHIDEVQFEMVLKDPADALPLPLAAAARC